MAQQNIPASDTSASRPPKFIVPLGRGGRGKSFWARWAIERAQAAGRHVVIADADRTNPTLSAYFKKTLTPKTADDRDVRSWVEQIVEQQIEERFTTIIDFGGGDLVLKNLARELRLVEFLAQNGIQAIAVHLIGPDVDDLAYLQEVERDVFAPPATILVLNENLVPAYRTAATAFGATVKDHEILQKAVTRGARLVFMPDLRCAADIDLRRQSFAAAEAGQPTADHKPIGPIGRQRIAIWLREMEDTFADVQEMLP